MRRVLLGLAVLLASPALAQTTPQDCLRSGHMLLAMAGWPVELPEPDMADGMCRVTDAEFEQDLQTIRVDVMEWRIVGLEALMAGQDASFELDIRVEGLRVFPKAEGFPRFAYALEALHASQPGVALTLSMAMEEGVLVMDQAMVTMDGPDNAVWADLAASGANLTDPSGLQLDGLSIGARADGVFEAMVLPILMQSLPLDDAQPIAPQVAALKTDLVAQIRDLPDPIFPEATRAALAEVVTDFPVFRGQLDIVLDVGDGLPLVELAINPQPPASLPEALEMLEGVRVLADYTPAE
ncbi:hypothetical protein V8J82_03115 [Gymnodinialimonas sp. 2305UL16-5]|uniref:hypothetical protein n=1 Tax=Gymnodinialimonas mytili TaxID=3126503 RepID=UPI0030B3193C